MRQAQLALTRSSLITVYVDDSRRQGRSVWLSNHPRAMRHEKREKGIPRRLEGIEPPPWPNDWLEWSFVATLLGIPAIITVCLYMLYV